MQKLQSCVIAAVDGNDLDLYKHFFSLVKNNPDKNIFSYVEDAEIEFVNLSETIPPNSGDERVDLLIIEDNWRSIAETIRALQGEGVARVVVAIGYREVHVLLNSWAAGPPSITLDFMLQQSRDWSEQTRALYMEIKNRWPLTPVIGVTAWESTDEGEEFPESAGLVNLLRSNGDNVFNKQGELYSFLPALIRNAISIYQNRQAKLAAEMAAEKERKKSEQLERLAKLKGVPPLEELDKQQSPSEKLIGEALGMKQLYWYMAKYAPSDIPILITGKSGTGKELIASAIHKLSSRRDNPFLAFNCAAIPETLIESELFGHEKGAFTGAHQKRRGLFEDASGGTILLDEIGATTIEFQTKLLRALAEHEIKRVGSNKPIKIDVRVLAATSVELEKATSEGTFRLDLYERLHGGSFPTVPDLADRPEDIPILANHFLGVYGRKDMAFSEDAIKLLSEYSWEGNVRQLEGLIERAVLLAPADSRVIGRSILILALPRLETRAVRQPEPFRLTRDLANAFEWLNALEVATVKVQDLGLDITLREVGKHIASPFGGTGRTSARLSQVIGENRRAIEQLFEEESYKDMWPAARTLVSSLKRRQSH